MFNFFLENKINRRNNERVRGIYLSFIFRERRQEQADYLNPIAT